MNEYPLQKRSVEKRRSEIANHAVQTLAAVDAGTAKKGTVGDLWADLTGDE